MVLRITEGAHKGLEIELSEAQINAVYTILGLNINTDNTPFQTSYRCYTDETVVKLTKMLESNIKPKNN